MDMTHHCMLTWNGVRIETAQPHPKQHSMWAPVGPQLGKVGPQMGPGWAPFGNAAWDVMIEILNIGEAVVICQNLQIFHTPILL